MGGNTFVDVARSIILMYVKKMYVKKVDLEPEDIHAVWLCKTLQNCKGLFYIHLTESGLYFEVTYNGDKDEMYIDLYKKIDNVVVVKEDNIGGTNYEMRN